MRPPSQRKACPEIKRTASHRLVPPQFPASPLCNQAVLVCRTQYFIYKSFLYKINIITIVAKATE